MCIRSYIHTYTLLHSHDCCTYLLDTLVDIQSLISSKPVLTKQSSITDCTVTKGMYVLTYLFLYRVVIYVLNIIIIMRMIVLTLLCTYRTMQC